MNNSDLILTKNRVLHKVKLLLEGLQESLLRETYLGSGTYDHEVFSTTPKISRGENYGGLPYLVLDYPRQFDSLNILVIRIMFWWGNFFSVTLHLSGTYQQEVMPAVIAAYPLLAQRDFYLGVNTDPWEHHFEADNYVPIRSLTPEAFEEGCRSGEHLKIATHWPLWDANFVVEDLEESWKTVTGLIR